MIAEAFNRDIALARVVGRMRAELGVVNAIETGTFHGKTARYLGQVFDRVISVESNRTYYDIAKVEVSGMDNVEIVEGDSRDHMGSMLTRLDGRTFVFLDAHWYGYCPINDELLALRQHRRLDPIVVIHDFQNPHRPEFGYDQVNGHPLNWQFMGRDITNVFDSRFQVFYNGVSEGARRGVIFAGHDLDAIYHNYGAGLGYVDP